MTGGNGWDEDGENGDLEATKRPSGPPKPATWRCRNCGHSVPSITPPIPGVCRRAPIKDGPHEWEIQVS